MICEPPPQPHNLQCIRDPFIAAQGSDWVIVSLRKGPSTLKGKQKDNDKRRLKGRDPGPESAPKSAFLSDFGPGSECRKECSEECFLALLKVPKSTCRSTLPARAPRHEDGGRDRNSRVLWSMAWESDEKHPPELRHGWPATGWETGPEPKMAGEMAGGHFSAGFRKMARQTAGQLKFGDSLTIRPVARPFFDHSLPRPFRRPFLGHFWFWAGGQRSHNSRVPKKEQTVSETAYSD